jgi:predicted RNA binding protein YcfA (HicA-like mRNA interferase family)
MKLPRDLSGDELIRKLSIFGYTISRQTGSHVRLTRKDEKEDHITIPRHSPLKVGTLNNILTDAAVQLKMSKEELIQLLKK